MVVVSHTHVLFFFNDTATTEIYTLSLHDALPIYWPGTPVSAGPASRSLTAAAASRDRKSTRLNSSHPSISYAVFCLKKKKAYTCRCPDVAAAVALRGYSDLCDFA